MTIEKQQNGKQLILKLSGELNTITAPELMDILKDHLDSIDELVLDMSGLVFISSAGLRAVLVAQQKLGKRGGVTIRNADKTIRKTFEMIGFDEFIKFD